ncbi:hypothetical protein LTR08_008104 [Meristemomyces frigidus]|nr:hypothetical protein LTR08_008104 [Meristemomyces frigidus]
MTELTINDADFASLAGQSVVVTGGSSGIGLATTHLLLSIGASVINGDLAPPPLEHDNLAFVKTDVTHWADLKALFARAKDLHGRIDHVFANAGISGRADYLEDALDAAGELLEPATQTFDVNLRGMVNTTYLGMHYMRHQRLPGGSVVLTASASSFQRFRVADYTTAKHGVLGFMRGVVPNLVSRELPIRVNALAPGWTVTGMVPQAVVEALGGGQGPEVVARSAVLLMADKGRQGQLVYSAQGRYWEVEEGRLLGVGREIVGGGGDDEALERLMKTMAEAGVGGEGSLGGS